MADTALFSSLALRETLLFSRTRNFYLPTRPPNFPLRRAKLVDGENDGESRASSGANFSAEIEVGGWWTNVVGRPV